MANLVKWIEEAADGDEIEAVISWSPRRMSVSAAMANRGRLGFLK